MEIWILKRQGKSIRAIARELSMSRETVRRYLRSPELEPVYGPRAPKPSKLDPHKAYVRQRLLDAAPRRLPATVLLRELRARGYDGGVTILKDWLAGQRPVVAAPEIRRFETDPGYQAQVDWTSIRRGKNRLSAFVATLGYSRFSFVWFTIDETFENEPCRAIGPRDNGEWPMRMSGSLTRLAARRAPSSMTT